MVMNQIYSSPPVKSALVRKTDSSRTLPYVWFVPKTEVGDVVGADGPRNSYAEY